MTIRYKLLVITLFYFVLAVSATLSLQSVMRDIQRAQETGKWAGLIVKEVGELGILTYDYLRNPKTRIRQQWISKQNALTELLKEDFPYKVSGNILQRMRQGNTLLPKMFNNVQKLSYDTNTSSQDNKLSQSLHTKLVSQMLIELQRLVSSAFQMQIISNKHLSETQSKSNAYTLVFLLLMAAGLIAGVFIILRSVIRPISNLQTGINKIRQGDLGHRVGTPVNDEIGELSRAFDNMTASLEHKTMILMNHQDNLTELVSERTESLEKQTHELDNKRNQIRAILDTVADGIITINDTGLIETFNPSAEIIFGYTTKAAIGNNINSLIPEIYSPENKEQLSRNFDSDTINSLKREAIGLRRDGSSFPLELHINEMCLNMETKFTISVRDITERKKTEQLKSQFISTVSHELRTPLTSIRGALGLILGGASGEIPDKANKMITMAERNCKRLTLLINDLLDFEKLETGNMAMNFNTVNLERLTNQAIESNQGYAIEHDVNLKLIKTIPEALVHADDNRLLQVFANLISNAVKYSPKHGCIEISITQNDNHFRVTVRDYGPGIAEAFQPRIFQRFSQADSSDTREKGGTGLGLYITKNIIKLHSGYINFSTPEDGGSAFYFELPALADKHY